MPRHGPGLGAGNFPAANKLLMRYENDRAYKLHQQKINNVKHRLDVTEPKKQNHLILRLKQIQKEEERQAEIDHENKILLNKMTHVLKYGGNIDNWNNYESRSLNYPFRERQNEEIARENIGIARRLETVKPKLTINKWEKDYQQHKYLKRLWNDSVKDFGEFTPRRYRSRMSRARSLETSLDDTYDEDFNSVGTSEEKKLPKLKDKRNQFRTAKSETNVPVTKSDNKSKPSTKLPKIIPHKALVERDFSMYYGESTVKSAPPTERSNGKPSDDSKIDKENDSENAGKEKPKEDKRENKRDRSPKKNSKAHGRGNADKNEKGLKGNEESTKSLSSMQSEKYVTNDLERVKTLVSEDKDEADSNNEGGREKIDTENKDEESNKNEECNKTNEKADEEDDFFDKENGKAYEERNESDPDVAKSESNGNEGQKESDGGSKSDETSDGSNENGETKPDEIKAEKANEEGSGDIKESQNQQQKAGASKKSKKKKASYVL